VVVKKSHTRGPEIPPLVLETEDEQHLILLMMHYCSVSIVGGGMSYEKAENVRSRIVGDPCYRSLRKKLKRNSKRGRG